MHLVDTSVWLDFLRGQHTGKVEHLKLLLSQDTAHLADIIYQEILQGARSQTDLTRLRDYFRDQRFCASPTRASFEAAAEIYARARWTGLTIRSNNDCLIAQLAIEQDLVLLHDDADFEKIAKVEPRLKLA